jgi:hypothetical protein
MNNVRPWTTGLDNSFISKLTQRQTAAGIGVYAERPTRDGNFISFDEWDRESREIGREIIAEHPEYAYILQVIDTNLKLTICGSCGLEFAPRIVKRILGTQEMGADPSTICQVCYNQSYPL